MFFAPTLFKQTRPVDLILPLQNQLLQLQQIVGVDKLAPATSSLSLSQIIAFMTGKLYHEAFCREIRCDVDIKKHMVFLLSLIHIFAWVVIARLHICQCYHCDVFLY